MQQMIAVLRTDKDKNELLTNYEIQVLETVGPLAPMLLTPFLRYCLPKQEHIEGDGDVRVLFEPVVIILWSVAYNKQLLLSLIGVVE